MVVGNLHNTRILRFLLVLIVVILTIFIYASYSTTATLTPTHIHVAAPPPPTPQQLTAAAAAAAGHQLKQQRAEQLPAMVVLNNTGEFGLAPAAAEAELPAGSSNKFRSQDQLQHKKAAQQQQQQHRLPTIDEDALLDGGAAGASPSQAGSEQVPNFGDELLEEQQYVQNIDTITGE